jgi:hypothetical protein
MAAPAARVALLLSALVACTAHGKGGACPFGFDRLAKTAEDATIMAMRPFHQASLQGCSDD